MPLAQSNGNQNNCHWCFRKAEAVPWSSRLHYQTTRALYCTNAYLVGVSSTGSHCTDNPPLLLAQGMVKPQLMRLNSVEILGKETATVCYSKTHPGNGLPLCEIEASNNEHGDSPTINRLRDFQFPDVTEELSTLHPCKSCL